MAGTKSASVEQLLRWAETRANKRTRGARQQRDRDLASLAQAANTTAAGRTVHRSRIWERYLTTWAREFVKAYAKFAKKFGPPDAFAQQHHHRLRSSIRSHTQKGIRTLKQSTDTDYAAAGARCSPANQLTQYWIQKVSGDRFWATVKELTPIQ